MKVDLKFKGKADLNKRLRELRQQVSERMDAELKLIENNVDKFVKEFIDAHIHSVMKRAIGIKSFDDFELDSPLGRALSPHLDRIAAEWAKDIVNKPLPEQLNRSMKDAFNRGYENSVRGITYKLGEEAARKHRDKLRYELLGADDFVEQTEKKIVGAPAGS